MKPTVYQHRPTEIEAVRVGDTSWKALAEWCGGQLIKDAQLGRSRIAFIVVPTLHGRTRAYPGDYIARSPERGDFWPVDAATFEASYTKAKTS